MSDSERILPKVIEQIHMKRPSICAEVNISMSRQDSNISIQRENHTSTKERMLTEYIDEKIVFLNEEKKLIDKQKDEHANSKQHMEMMTRQFLEEKQRFAAWKEKELDNIELKKKEFKKQKNSYIKDFKLKYDEETSSLKNVIKTQQSQIDELEKTVLDLTEQSQMTKSERSPSIITGDYQLSRSSRSPPVRRIANHGTNELVQENIILNKSKSQPMTQQNLYSSPSSLNVKVFEYDNGSAGQTPNRYVGAFENSPPLKGSCSDINLTSRYENFVSRNEETGTTKFNKNHSYSTLLQDSHSGILTPIAYEKSSPLYGTSITDLNHIQNQKETVMSESSGYNSGFCKDVVDIVIGKDGKSHIVEKGTFSKKKANLQIVGDIQQDFYISESNDSKCIKKDLQDKLLTKLKQKENQVLVSENIVEDRDYYQRG